MWGWVVGLGIVMALQPLPVLATILLLAVENGLRKAFAFFLGEFLVLAVIAAATIALHQETSQSSAGTIASWVTLGLGVALVATGVRWGLQVRRGVQASKPKWMATLDRMQPWPAFLLGLFIPTYMVAVSAGAHIVGAHPSTAEAVAGVIVFLLIGMCTVYTPIVMVRWWPERSAPQRERMRTWLDVNWRAVISVLLLVVGAVLVTKGALALS